MLFGSGAFTGGLLVGVPGEVKGLYELHKRFGRVEWAKLVELVAAMARNGTRVSRGLAFALADENATTIRSYWNFACALRSLLFSVVVVVLSSEATCLVGSRHR